MFPTLNQLILIYAQNLILKQEIYVIFCTDFQENSKN